MYTDSQIEHINSSIDLLSLVNASNLKHSGDYWIGPCPFCGGEDRFTVKRTPRMFVWICRKCGNGKYEDPIAFLQKRDSLSLNEIADKVGANDFESKPVEQYVDVEKQKKIDRILEEFTTQEIWEALNRRMDEENRLWWIKQGINEHWQDYLSLGYVSEKKYMDKDELHVSPAYTIPYFHQHKEFKTMQYRLCNPVNPKDKYRFEYGLSSTYYMTTPTLDIRDKIVVLEGAKKAIVTSINVGDFDEYSYLAVPSKSDYRCVEDAVKYASRVWVILDPDATDNAVKLCQLIGKNSRLVEMPVKIDDAFNLGYLDRKGFFGLLEQGVKV